MMTIGLLIIAVLTGFIVVYSVKGNKKQEERIKELHRERLELIYEVERLQGLRKD